MNFKTKITELHYNKNAKGLTFKLLKFCSLFYGLISRLKNFLYDNNILKPHKADAVVISVGNFTTGGVGKTPVVAELSKYFIEKGDKPAVVLRGYGGKLNNKFVHVISDGVNLYYSAKLAGDEPYWHSINEDGCAVLTCSDRYKASKYAVEKLGCNIIILDDGFQHRKLHRDIDIVLVDSEKMFGNENLLPAGPLREGIEGFKRLSKLVIVSKNTDHTKAEKLARIFEKKYFNQKQNNNKNGESVLVCKIEPDYVYNIVTGELLEKGCDIKVVSAIGQPEQFCNFLKNDYNITETFLFDDHHQYNPKDINKIEGNIVTTEKDAVKLSAFGMNNIYALKLKTILPVAKLLSD